jgi:predicted N-acetyltransferase YhbS
VVTYRAARDEELESCIALQHLVFRPDQADAPVRYRSYVREDPTYQYGQTRIALIDDQIVAHLRVWDRKLAIRGQTITAGGIGSLLTHPDFRGQGIASGLLADTENYFKEVEYDIGLLFSIIGTPYYAMRGWSPVPVSTFEINVGIDVPVRDTVTRQLVLHDDIDAVRQLHIQCFSEYTGTELRDEAYCSTGPARYRSVFPRVGVERRGKLSGYINWDIVNERVWVVECCAETDDDYADLATLVIQATRDVRSASILGSLPKGHGLIAPLESATQNVVEWSTHDEMMVKISRWDLLRKKLEDGTPGLPEELPNEQAEIDAFWRVLLGNSEENSDWCKKLGACSPTFYWWTDFF